MNTIQEQWEIFSQQALPVDAPRVQCVEMRRAFYAGAAAMMGLSSTIADHDEDTGVMMLQGIHDELSRFVRDLNNGNA